MLLNPKWEIGDTCDVMKQRKQLEVFVKFCVYKLSQKHDASVETLKLQHYYTHNIDRLTDAVKSLRCNLKNSLDRLEKEILAVTSNDEESLRDLQKKIVFYITLLSGLGDPTAEAVRNIYIIKN